ncbi:helix-turn-helix domain-containing protein [Streptomyces cellostaticus]|uniref:helix-turn-helix domain-containing protein n=1 Tax=Streptomyces cellostaticus TaxID=67285 RepID=UPI002540EE54|nr:helix-turn-helix domain-containing protein [Streptomyces cellostaticus]
MEAWAHALGGLCEGPGRQPRDVVRDLGAVRVASVSGGAAAVRGDGRGPGWHLLLVRHGELVLEQQGRTLRAGPGGSVLLDSGPPYRLRLAGTSNSVVSAHLGGRPRAHGRLRTRELGARPDLAVLVAGLLAGLAGESAPHRPGGEQRLGTVVSDLVTLLLDEEEPGDSALLPRIQAYISRNLSDGALTPDRVAAAHHISTRYLHRLFQRQGLTVASWIKAQRLDRCRRDLRDPGLGHLPVHVIGARWGFAQPADFSRAFRAAYGTTPTCFRAGSPEARGRCAPRDCARSANDIRLPAQQTREQDEARRIVPVPVHMGELHA